MNKVDLSVNIGSLKLSNPILLASGTVGYGDEIKEFIDLEKIGGIVTKSISLNPRKGNKPPRIVETPSGMLNAIGLANIGLRSFIDDKLPKLESLNTTVICNIAASSIDEYIECTDALKNYSTIKAFEINVSCPNVKDGGLIFGNNISYVAEITSKVRKITDKPIIIKLSPNVSNISDFAITAFNEGADAVTAINTLVGASFNVKTRKPKLSNITGGLSGPAIRPVAIAKVFEIHRRTKGKIIGSGGIMSMIDIIEFMIAGASAVELGTLNFIHPDFSEKFISELTNYCLENNIQNLRDLTGSYIIE